METCSCCGEPSHDLLVVVLHTVIEQKWVVVHLYHSRSSGVVSGETFNDKIVVKLHIVASHSRTGGVLSDLLIQETSGWTPTRLHWAITTVAFQNSHVAGYTVRLGYDCHMNSCQI